MSKSSFYASGGPGESDLALLDWYLAEMQRIYDEALALKVDMDALYALMQVSETNAANSATDAANSATEASGFADAAETWYNQILSIVTDFDGTASFYWTPEESLIPLSIAGWHHRRIFWNSTASPLAHTLQNNANSLAGPAGKEWTLGSEFIVVQWSTGTVTVNADSGVTIIGPTATAEQGDLIHFYQIAADTWLAIGIGSIAAGGGGSCVLTPTDDASTTYDLSVTDEPLMLRFTSASAVTLNLSVTDAAAMTTGATVQWRQVGAGTVTLVPEVGITVTSSAGLTTRTQHSQLMLMKITDTLFDLTGDVGSA